MKPLFLFNVPTICAALLLAAPGSVFSQTHSHASEAPNTNVASPYAGEQLRDIKALSKTDIDNLVKGAGMGYAKAAELNGYPGPMHVLELARPLKLTDAQRAATTALLNTHKQEAREIGAKIISAERELDAAFATQKISESQIATLTRGIALLQATLRAAHLQTHLKQTALLRGEQISAYQSLRGYVAANDSDSSRN
jgi:Spy/CpxP family protein refolding chaperone